LFASHCAAYYLDDKALTALDYAFVQHTVEVNESTTRLDWRDVDAIDQLVYDHRSSDRNPDS
jgi:hypothetical protein